MQVKKYIKGLHSSNIPRLSHLFFSSYSLPFWSALTLYKLLSKVLNFGWCLLMGYHWTWIGFFGCLVWEKRKHPFLIITSRLGFRYCYSHLWLESGGFCISWQKTEKTMTMWMRLVSWMRRITPAMNWNNFMSPSREIRNTPMVS